MQCIFFRQTCTWTKSRQSILELKGLINWILIQWIGHHLVNDNKQKHQTFSGSSFCRVKICHVSLFHTILNWTHLLAEQNKTFDDVTLVSGKWRGTFVSQFSVMLWTKQLEDYLIMAIIICCSPNLFRLKMKQELHLQLIDHIKISISIIFAKTDVCLKKTLKV